MALKPQMTVIETDISYFVNSITGTSTTSMERGGVVSAVTGAGYNPSGTAMDISARAAQYLTNPQNGTPLGILLNDFVNIDQSRQLVNPFKSEAQIGTKCVILKKGTVVTNMIAGTPAYLAVAYNGPSGLITATSGSFPTVIGRFLTVKDADGYAQVEVLL